MRLYVRLIIAYRRLRTHIRHARILGDDGPNLLPGAGAGFGLRLARTIAELHGGLMILENDPGHGVRAAVCLPIREERRMRLESPRPVEHGFDRGLVALADVLPLEAFSRSG